MTARFRNMTAILGNMTARFRQKNYCYFPLDDTIKKHPSKTAKKPSLKPHTLKNSKNLQKAPIKPLKTLKKPLKNHVKTQKTKNRKNVQNTRLNSDR
jgi:hypothetical protein